MDSDEHDRVMANQIPLLHIRNKSRIVPATTTFTSQYLNQVKKLKHLFQQVMNLTTSAGVHSQPVYHNRLMVDEAEHSTVADSYLSLPTKQTTSGRLILQRKVVTESTVRLSFR